MTEVKFDSFTACTSKSVRAACSAGKMISSWWSASSSCGSVACRSQFSPGDDCGCLQIRVDGRGYGHNRKVLLYLQQMKI